MNNMTKRKARGYTLVATLLLLLLMTGLGLGMMMMTNTETNVGGNDMENSLAYHGAEAGMEKMTVDLASLYEQNQVPLGTQISGLSAYAPSIPSIHFDQYSLSAPLDTNGKPLSHVDTISQGNNAGLIALVSPITLQVAASRPGGMSVNMIRTVEVAQIPVFQFGVFSQSDLSYFPGPSFNFAGRVATNGNLFISTGAAQGLIFQQKLSAVGEVVRDYLSNGYLDTTNYAGPVYIPSQPNGCATTQNTTACPNLSNQGSPAQGIQGSVYGGVPGNGALTNSSWGSTSNNLFKGYIVNHAKPLSLPFASAAAGPIEVIRKPVVGESTASSIGQSREYNRAAIRILLADTQALLHPTSAGTDADDVQLVNNGTSVTTSSGAVTWARGGSSSAAYGPVQSVLGTPANSYTYFAEANQDCSIADPNATEAVTNKWCEPNDQYRPAYVTGKQWNLLAADQTNANKGAWLRVEYLDNNGNWNGVTRQWLSYGFARGPAPPTAPGTNTVHPRAILILQQQADRDGNGT